MDFAANNSTSSSSPPVLQWCFNDTADPGATSSSEELQSYADSNVTISEWCRVDSTNQEPDQFNLFKLQVFLIISLGLMIVATIVGNILVCLSVVLVRKLRHPSNYLLVSLAISDLCVAILVMPLALQFELSGTWNLSPSICDLWVSFDVACCTSSILNLCMISIDRYLAITKPLTYGVRRTTKRILSFICGVWIASCLISIPPVLVLGNEHGDENLPTCQVSQNIGYQLYATLSAFYIPLIVMIFVYYKIYVAAKRVIEAEQRAQIPAATQQPQMPLLKPKTDNSLGAPRAEEVWMRIESCNCYGNAQVTETIQIKAERHHGAATALFRPQTNGMSTTGSGNAIRTPTSQSLTLKPAIETRLKRCSDASVINLNAANKRRTSSVLRERKASFTLGVIMTAFIVCWLPFFILALLRPFSGSFFTIPRILTSTTLWLGYANSMLNPIIYVTFHQDFRRAFKYLLCLQCASMGSRLRAEAYQSQYGTDRGHYAGGDFATTATVDTKLKLHKECRSTAMCSSFEIASRDKIELEATL